MGTPFCQAEEEVKLQPQRDHSTPYLSSQTMQEEAQDPSRGSGDDSKNISQSQRRRTAVACQRCRRRKIKCSGDLGNGQACSNCRSSKSDDCVFLRVNSAPMQTKSHYAAGWACSLLGPNASSSRSHQQIGYNSHMARAIAPMHSAALMSPSYSMTQPSIEYGALFEPLSNYRTLYQVGYDEDTAYGLNISSYLSSNSALGAIGVCGNNTAGRIWRSSDRVESCNSALYSDPEGDRSSNPSLPPATRASHTSPPIDPNTPIPGIGVLPSHDRTLPNPTTNRGSSTFLPSGSLTEGQSANSTATTLLTSTYKPAYRSTVDGGVPSGIPCTRMSSRPTCSPANFHTPSSSSPIAEFGYVLSSEGYPGPLPSGGKTPERLPFPPGWKNPIIKLADNPATNDTSIHSVSPHPIQNPDCC